MNAGPHRIIQHFTINDENYDVAIELLNDDFLDIEFIINEIFKQVRPV